MTRGRRWCETDSEVMDSPVSGFESPPTAETRTFYQNVHLPSIGLNLVDQHTAITGYVYRFNGTSNTMGTPWQF